MNATTSYTALKCVYKGKAKGYAVEVVRDAQLHMIHFGFMVYESAAYALAELNAGRLVSGWNEKKRAAVARFLESEPK